MPIIKISTASNSDNKTTFNIIDSDGAPVNLTDLGATLVTVSVCDGRYCCGTATIDSNTPQNVSFSDDILSVSFGKLLLARSSAPYKPKISYISPDSPNGEVIVASGYRTEIQIMAVC